MPTRPTSQGATRPTHGLKPKRTRKREFLYTAITREDLTVVEPRQGLLGEAIVRKVRRVSGLTNALNE